MNIITYGNTVSIKDQIKNEIIHEIQRKFWDQGWDEKLETGTNALTRGTVYSKIRVNNTYPKGIGACNTLNEPRGLYTIGELTFTCP